MGEMRSSRRTEVSLKNTAPQLTDPNVGTELTAAWKSLAQSKAALRHIENRLEAGPGSGVLLDSVMDLPKKKSSRKVRCRDGQQADDTGGSSKHRGRSQQSPEKSSSRSPLRNTTQDSNVRRNNSVEFREPLASYREATPPPYPSSQLEACSLQSVPGSSYASSPHPSDPLLSQLVYQRDTRDKQTDRDLDSTRSSALENTEVRYLNDLPALVNLRASGQHPYHTGVNVSAKEDTEEEHTPKAQTAMDSQESSPFVASTPGSVQRGENTPSTSPGSASQRLENLRRHQPDNKLEKLKERIRRQRQHLEEAAEREKLLGHLEQPITTAVRSSNGGMSTIPTAKVRKVAPAPPAPIYKGFNSTETKIRTPDGKVWKEEEFHNLSREIYRDLSRQFAESTRSRHQQQTEHRADRSKERKPSKPVRKVHRVAPSSDLHAKPVISPASWREGQKLVNMILGPGSRLPREDRPQRADGLSKTASRHRSSSESKSRSCPNSTERPHSGFQEQSKSHSIATSKHSPINREKTPVAVRADMLSADIQGILDDLQLECKAAEKEERARQRSRGGSSGRRGRGGSGSRTRTPVSSWGINGAAGSSSRVCRSASPTTRRPKTADTDDTVQKKRHYDADTVRQYISRQQEERKRRQVEEKRSLREEAERRKQRLQELYRKQKEVAKTVVLPSEPPVAPVQKRLQETYNRLLLEEAQLGEEATQMQPAAPLIQMPQKPMYQPSGESDKENKRLEAPQSPSSSDRSLTDQLPPPLSRNDLDVGFASLLPPDRLSPVRPTIGPSTSALAAFDDHLLSRLLRLETAVAAGDMQRVHQPATALSNRSQSKMSRIEALKATAASLSNRIETEARKLAGEGINYGAATSLDVDPTLPSRPFQGRLDDECWAEVEHSSYNGAGLPGTGNLYTNRGQIETNGTHSSMADPQMCSADVAHHYARGKRKLINGLEKMERLEQEVEKDMAQRKTNGFAEDENRTNHINSSDGSISEGPLLSEESFCEDDASPPQPSTNCAPRPAERLEAVSYHASPRRNLRLSEFQREAERCTALSSPFAQYEGSKAAWEELNKGSPLSVINLFIKNFHGHDRVNERNSPNGHTSHSDNSPVDAAVYEDDFVSSHSSGASSHLKRSPNSRSHFEELMRRSPHDKSTGGISSHHSSIHSPHVSSSSPCGSASLSKQSVRKKGPASDQSDATLVGEHRSSGSPPSRALSSESRNSGSDRSSAHSQDKSVHSNDISGETSHQSSGLDSTKASAARPKHTSPSGSSDAGSSPGAHSLSEHVRSGSMVASKTNTAAATVRSGRAEAKATGELQYSPAVLQQRMAAELQYLESIEESIRQLGDVERVMGVSLAQQESASLAQMLKANQEQHDRDLYELKIKAEREALEMQLQLEENRQRMARAHLELQENLAGAQKETLEGLQEATMKIMSQQAEAARYTADTARHIKEMTESARSQIVGAPVDPSGPSGSCMLVEEQKSSYSKQRQTDKNDSDSFQSEMSRRRIRPEEQLTSLNSLSHSDSLSYRRSTLSGADSSSCHSPSRVSSDHREQKKKDALDRKWKKGGADDREVGSSSIEEEALTAANDSICSDNIPSAVDEKDSTSVATDYSLKFDESMTEDEIEERSFRSVLPSEAHRRGTKERKARHHEESEDDGANHDTTSVSSVLSVLKPQDASMAFSGGQDSFSQFTMDMVRQYMKDEEVRLQHQSSLLRLRQKALKEKTKTELAWLEHQKKRLRHKGEDDKMPPIRKKQRGLLMKLQQEQAEIKRLQEANKAARKERQLLLKQQEEIERMRNSTLKLKERLKCAGGEEPPETPVSETPASDAASSIMRHSEDVRSPSPSLSVSGSETSSIMQKLKKMRSHMDEKFLTKREQQLMQRRHNAEELLQWKQRLDQEEAEVRRMEKEALAVWERQKNREMDSAEGQKKEDSDVSSRPPTSVEPRTDSEKEYVSEADYSSATPESSIHTEELESQQPGNASSVQPAPISETPLVSAQCSPANYTQDFTSVSQSPGRQSIQSPFKGSHSPAASPSDASSKTKMQLRSPSRTTSQARTQPTDSLLAPQSEPISDQSDIESRIKALKEELRKRKFMALQLKKEQKKRHKERLKAQEASLLRQLESYDNFIEKTKAELNKEPDSTSDTKTQIKESTSLVDAPALRADSTKLIASSDHNDLPHTDLSRTTSVPEVLSEDDPSTVTPTPVHGSPDGPSTGLRSHLSTEGLLKPSFKEAPPQVEESGDENIESYQRSDILEELEVEVSTKSEDQRSEHLFTLKKGDRPDSQAKLSTSEHVASFMSEDVSLKLDKDIKTKQSCEAEGSARSGILTPSQPHSAAGEVVTPAPSSHRSDSPDSVDFSSKREAPVKDVDGYHDDFESSVNSSPREDYHSSKPVSPAESKDSPSRATPFDSQDEEVEEEIAEELSHHSGMSGDSQRSGRLLDLDNQTEKSQDSKGFVSSIHSPHASPQQPPLSPVIDEMSTFIIGDRVLVGGVQPGTLRFKGPTSFANGFWAGVELDKSEGSNNGTYDGVAYFECNERHGIFAPPDKVTHLPDKFEVYTDTTEDEDSFFDDLPDKSDHKRKTDEDKSQKDENQKTHSDETSHKSSGSRDKKLSDESVHKTGAQLNSQHHNESPYPVSNGNIRDIILDFENAPTTLIISDMEKTGLEKKKPTTLLDKRDEVHDQHQLTPADVSAKEERKDRIPLDTFADTLLDNFVIDTVKQFAEIKKSKEQKIQAANQLNGDLVAEDFEDGKWFTSVHQKDDLPFFLPAEKEELSSPELCNRPESPVLGASGQEELAKRLAELELSRELLDEFGDDQDWFDEDFGLSSRREQQRLKEKQREEEEEARLGRGPGLGRSGSSAGAALGGLVSSPGGEQQVKTPPRPELPLPLPPKLPEQPAMVVPHSATEVEKMVHAATREIWESCGLGKEGSLILAQQPNPKPSAEYLGKEASSQDQEALCIRSYRKAVYDLTWEILQEIYAEDTTTDQPQWIKPRRAKSSSFHRVKTPGDIARVQEFVAAEVLKLYGLAKDQNQKNDWQKMLKFGRKKRDRVDHILVQELHEEEALWVNYDEDELFVKMQLADSIFDALLKDTANSLTLIYDKRAKREALS
ncbi:uncharacterized protein V6R79_001175 [Siganus canaliculatus]